MKTDASGPDLAKSTPDSAAGRAPWQGLRAVIELPIIQRWSVQTGQSGAQ